MISSIFNALKTGITPEKIALVVRVALIIGVGFPLLSLIRKVTKRLIRDKLSVQSEILIQRTVYYIGLMIILISVLNELGFKLSAILGAAGVFGIAIGFASQTSISNIISGIFLISEKPFVIGDVVQVGQTIGEIVSIDLLSLKLRTQDNRFVRVPNETMIKTEVINNTRYDTRRVQTSLTVSFSEDLDKLLPSLKELALSLPLADKTREPLVQIESINETGIKINVGVWGKTSDYIELKNALLIEIKNKLESELINISLLRLPTIQNAKREANNPHEKVGTNEYETQH